MMLQKISRGFGSDNHAPIHPEILKKIATVNVGHAPSYGTDEITLAAQKEFQKHFGSSSITHFVFNGTAANVLALRSLCDSFQSVICADISHLNVDECGAPEHMAHVKLIPVHSTQAKLDLKNIQAQLIRKGDQHFSQVKAISLTQPTELGTCYSLKEIKAISEYAKSENLYLHIDGARLANACVFHQCGFAEMTRELGVDVVSFGGTKNGLLGAEAVVFLNTQLEKNFRYHRKQNSQLPSKTRYLAAQFLAYFENDLWKTLAEQSLKRSQELYEGLQKISGLEVSHSPQSNAVFVRFPKHWIKPLREKYFFYVWNEQSFECRLMTSWDHTEEDIVDFLKFVQDISLKEKP